MRTGVVEGNGGNQLVSPCVRSGMSGGSVIEAYAYVYRKAPSAAEWGARRPDSLRITLRFCSQLAFHSGLSLPTKVDFEHVPKPVLLSPLR